MQIHELNKRPAKINETQVNEVDLVGPGSIFNVGKQVLKNPSALISNTAMGAAKQAAAQASAASSAGALYKQGYKAGSTPRTTPQQQLAKVKSNPAVQQMVKNIAAQWPAQGAALYSKIRTAPMGVPTTESVRITNLNSGDPNEQQLLAAIQKQELDSQISKLKTEPPKAQEKAKADAKLMADVNTYSAGFQAWASDRLAKIGVRMDKVEADPAINDALQNELRSIAIIGLSKPNSPELISNVEEYFYIAIATNQAQQSDQSSVAGPAAAAGDGAPQPSDRELVAQSGVPITLAQIEALGQAMQKAAGGETTIRNTGNTLLNAVARLAGFKVA